jgi:hypothetical protein
LNVIPNRESRENAVILSSGKYASCVGFPFNGADSSPSEEVTPEYSSTSACEKSQLIHLISKWERQMMPEVDGLVEKICIRVFLMQKVRSTRLQGCQPSIR